MPLTRSGKRTYFQLIGSTFAAIIIFWLLDAAVDAVVHYDEPFIESLLFNSNEIAFRSFFSICFLLFGLYVANILNRQQQLEEQLVQREHYLQSIVTEVADCVMLLAPDCSVVDMNPAGMQMIDEGFREGIIGSPLCPLIDQKHDRDFKKFIENVCQGNVDTYSYTITDSEGYSRWLESKGVPFRDAPNDRTLVLAVTRDITDSRMASKALEQAHERFTTVLDGLNAIVYVADPDTYEVLFINQFTRDCVGDVEGQPCWKVFQTGLTGPCPDCSKERVVDYRGRATETVTRETFSTLNGRWYSMHGSAIRWVDGRMALLDVATDITEHKKAEDSLQQSLGEKEMLLKEIHHRVKNNLAVVQSLLRLQSSQLADERSKELLKESQSRIQSMSMIHEQLHNTSDLSGLNISQYINNMTRKLFHTYSVNASKVKLLVEVPEITVDVSVLVPLGLVINELITNALKYAFPDDQSGSLAITLVEGQSNRLVLSIRDDGVGIPDDLNIHEPQSLGMTIVSSLTKQIKGQLEVLREQGTEFRITFLGNPFQ